MLSGQNYDASGSSGGGQVSCAITPDVATGNLIQYQQLIPLTCQAHALKGNRANSVRFTMTDNNNESVGFERGVHCAYSDQLVSYENHVFFICP